MEGRLIFQDRAGGKSSTSLLGITSGATLVALADTLKGFSNAQIIEASVLETDDMAPAGYPKTDPPFDSISVRARLVVKITDGDYPADEPKLLQPTLYCPISSMLEVVNGAYVLPVATAETIVDAIGTAIGWDLTLQYTELFGVQV